MTVSIAAGLLIIAIMISCNSAPTKNNTTASYLVAGSVVADANLSSTKIVADFTKNHAKVPTGIVRFSADTLIFRRPGFSIDSVFSLAKANFLYYGVGRDKVYLQDSSLFTDSASVRMSDSFSIIDVVPVNRQAQGLRSVSLQWSGADSAEGYVMATALKDSLYRGYGFSIYATSMNPAGTLPPNAFNLTTHITPDTGWYYLYVYAYTGVPDSALTSRLLPVPFPSQLADNIAVTNLAGHFGTVRVVLHDSVHVVTLP